MNTAVPKIQALKFKYFGHDQVILHEHHIRKQKGDYAFLRRHKKLRTQFLSDVAALVADTPFEIISVVIPNVPSRHGHPFGRNARRTTCPSEQQRDSISIKNSKTRKAQPRVLYAKAIPGFNKL